MLKVAILGAGTISGVHVDGWNNVEDAKLCAVFDKAPSQMEKYPELSHYTDFDEMIDKEKPDIVDICLPTTFHVEFSLRAMKRGIHVLCEKPVSLNSEDVSLLYRTAEENNVRFMVAQVLRFWNEYMVLADICRSERFGKLLAGSMRRIGIKPTSGWFMDPALSGGITHDLHIHDIDFLVDLFGAPKDKFISRRQRPDFDFLHVVYNFGDFDIDVSAGWFSSDYPFTAEFLFSFERAVVAFEGGKLTVYTSEKLEDGEFTPPAGCPYEREIRYFTDCVINGKPIEKVTEESLRNVLGILDSLNK